MGRIRKVENFYLLGNCVSDGNRELILGFNEGGILQEGLQRHNRRLVIRHLDTYRIREGHYSHTTRIKGHCDIFLEVLDRSNLDSRSRIDLIKSDSRAYHGLYVPDIYPIVCKGIPDLEVVALQLVAGDNMAHGLIISEKVHRRELE